MKKKIEALTEDQIKQQPIYRDKWIRIGHDTSACDREEAETFIELFYKQAKDKDVACSVPDKVIWADSPWQALNMVTESYDISKQDAFSNFCYGQHDASWLGFYDYFYNVVGLKEEVEPILPLMEFSKRVGWFLPFKEVIYICERPCVLSLKSGNDKVYLFENVKPDIAITNGQLHCDGGPAIGFRDGKKLYYLNGVRVPEELAMTPHGEIDPSGFVKIQNAEVRREFIRKVGIERVMEQVGAEVLDTDGDYELVNFNVSGSDNEKVMRPFLKMVNPSIGVYHVEGIAPEINTVKEALIWRNGTDTKPTVLT